MCHAIAHRGPDEEGIRILDGVGLGARRLSIIDIEGGRQPLFNEDRSVCAVFNGEIYNYRELRRELLSRGHVFSSSTDGEVIVHLWEEHGPAFLSRLNGMFALALHDSGRGRLFLARDRLGIKPLYWAADGRRLVFGSEIKVLLAPGLLDRELDLAALAEFLAWEYVPAPRTLLRGFRKLDAAESMEVDLAGGSMEIRRWWDPPGGGEGRDAPGDAAGAAAWEEEVDAKITECVRRQLVSDVPLGAFLSGGVDSSLVTAAMEPALTFSIGFEDRSYDELPWSRRVAGHLGLPHRTEVVRPDISELFEKLMPFMDDPIGDFSIFPTFLLSRLARREVTVALSGDGGDEIFGGYETYQAQALARVWRRLPRLLRSGLVAPLLDLLPPRPQKKGLVNKAKRFVEGVEHDKRLGHARWRLFLGEALRRELFTEEALGAMPPSSAEHVLELMARAGGRSELDRCLYVDMRSYLADNCLVKVDRMSMACSLEVRVPLLDHELVELAFRVPPRLKVHRGRSKILLKRIAARHVPRECVYRPKEGFSIPIKHWLGTSLRGLMHELLQPSRLSAEGIFRVETVERIMREHLEGSHNHSHLLWSLMVFHDWRRRWAA
jgi:asparagine synthase (glutamine-hydrolysing)